MASINGKGNGKETDYGELIEVARQYFQSGATQVDIAKSLHIPQARVSRLLRQAEAEDIVQHLIVPPPLRKLESNVMRGVEDKGVRDVKVVPRGIGRSAEKNEENLGSVAAEYFVEALMAHPGDTVSVCMSCGNTMLSLITHFTEFLGRRPDALAAIKQKTVVLYPLSLYWEPTLRFHIDSEYPSTSLYPSALVVYLAMRLMTLGCRVIAHAPQPPLDFYREFDSMGDQERIRLVKKYSGYLEGAKNADIFLVGVGAGRGDMRYRRVLDELGIALADEGAIAGEIGYQPFNSMGEFMEFPKLIAVTGEELSTLSRTTSKVVAVVGGETKVSAIQALLNRDQLPFNVLITDEAVAGIFGSEAEATLGPSW